ncbi:tetratricopeptide repeat protein [Aquimarina gracilis]|uniref:Tetratricopeptide repeat protein n=1 Tax=Aquimarina gracilis TaxID=874422 RepID=A0ABU5ZRD3_9FLAO|nr:tetratricopeptide repeat protein [Aquimarina gracilis]MEB3344636.1 tetratricopeptide repeat protein [Aquimarina gracilis]
MPYFLIIALQGFCVYHAIKNRKDYYWFFVIIFLPVIGSIIYLLTQVFNKKDLDIAQDEIINIVNPSKKIKDLQKQLDFADTFQNRVNLADALFESGDYTNAIDEFETALNGSYSNNFGVIKKLIKAYSEIEDYNKVIFYAEKIDAKPDFNGSKSQFFYGLALEELGQSEKAEEQLRKIDQRYSNYAERYRLAQFFIEKGKHGSAKEILSEIISESQHMTKTNRVKYREVIKNTKKLLAES